MWASSATLSGKGRTQVPVVRLFGVMEQASPESNAAPPSQELIELRRRVKRLRRSILATEGDLARHVEWPEHRRVAGLLSTWRHLIERGASSAELIEYGEDGSERIVSVALDPKESVPEAIQRLHRLASRGERGEKVARVRLARLRQEMADLEAMLRQAEAGAVVEMPAPAQTGKQRATGPTAKGKPAPAADPLERVWKGATNLEKHLRPRVFEAAGGAIVLVGRTAQGNDVLTTRIANGNDFFLHVAGSPGSHVILRWKSKEPPPADALQDAAQLALHYSKQKDASRGTVTYCQRKHVSKPRGAKPGLVYVSRGKTLQVRQDAARLARLLGREEG